MNLLEKLEEMEIVWMDGDGSMKWNKSGFLTPEEIGLLKRIEVKE